MLAKRKGFVKLAMQTGAAIIPAYTFGTNQMFYRPCGPNSLLAKLSGALQVSIDGYPASRECVACDSCSARCPSTDTYLCVSAGVGHAMVRPRLRALLAGALPGARALRAG